MTPYGWFVFGGGAIGAIIGIAIQLYKEAGYAEGKLLTLLFAFAGTLLGTFLARFLGISL